jgi:hypothetical protein
MPFLQGYQLLLTEEPCLTYVGPLGGAGVVWKNTGKQIQLIHGLTAKKPRVKKLQCTVADATGGNSMGSLLGRSDDGNRGMDIPLISSLGKAITPAYGLAVELSSISSGSASEETPAFDLSFEVGRCVPLYASRLTAHQADPISPNTVA